MAGNGRTSVGSVYHSLEEVLSVLKKPEFGILPEVQQLISIFNSERERCKKVPQSAASESSKKFPFIVLEGLDGTGKTTVTKKLSKALGATSRGTPPQCLLGLRDQFDKHPIQLRRAFYSLGNYIAADEVEVLRFRQPVVMDRFWHSTAAYAVASEARDGGGSLAEVPAAGDPVYDWPADLLRPDAVLFLDVSEEVRNSRLSSRAATTPEEDKLKEDRVFRGNLVEVYKRMRNPGTIKIDSNGTIKNVLIEINTTIQHLTDKCNVSEAISSQ
ncbi:UMP-CMP kinase 2, mitochondrial-like [Bacillus rossius redtenbacheri]|uniref:UMP-CMP kinase 2, mitochondrial-like n=1 Tax=Bacillus rossius redtenbacheri TaxID=93214 RepID=UPI002FDE7114